MVSYIWLDRILLFYMVFEIENVDLFSLFSNLMRGIWSLIVLDDCFYKLDYCNIF